MLKKQSAHRSMAVACGIHCTYVVAEEGQVLVSGSGWGEHGQLGLGDRENRLRMTSLAGDFAVSVVMVGAGGGHSALVDSDGELWMCGRGESGQCVRIRRSFVLWIILWIFISTVIHRRHYSTNNKSARDKNEE